jgi:hypothetical protein
MRVYLALFFVPILAVLGAAMPLDPELSAAAGLLLSTVLVSPFLMRVFSRVGKSKSERVPRLEIRRVTVRCSHRRGAILKSLVRNIPSETSDPLTTLKIEDS